MKKCFILSAMFLLPNFVQAADLTLPGEKWLAVFDKYICAAYGPAVERPQPLAQMNVRFEQITTDSSLDNALLKAEFQENGKDCRYNAILFADNAAQTSRLVTSIAYDRAATGEASSADCGNGKEVLDRALANNNYLFFGHPHNLTFMMPGVGGEAVCGSGSQTIGVNFKVKGKIPHPNGNSF